MNWPLKSVICGNSLAFSVLFLAVRKMCLNLTLREPVRTPCIFGAFYLNAWMPTNIKQALPNHRGWMKTVSIWQMMEKQRVPLLEFGPRSHGEAAAMPRAASSLIVPYPILKSLPICWGLSVLQWFMQVWYLLGQGCWTSSSWCGWLLQTGHHTNVAILLPKPAWLAAVLLQVGALQDL